MIDMIMLPSYCETESGNYIVADLIEFRRTITVVVSQYRLKLLLTIAGNVILKA